MSKSCDLSFQQKSLFQQGYQQFTPKELKQLEWGLRFTPLVCSSITAYALFIQSPILLFSVAILGLMAFVFPAGHPMDLLYNHVIRHSIRAVKLPENPFQRRLACLSAGIMNVISAVLFLFTMPAAALIVGIMLLALQAIVIFTHFCTLSWMYEGVMRLFGKWNVPMHIDDAKSKLSQGALVIDVRSANEFASESLEGTVNLPLEELDNNIDKFTQGTCLLFCNSGTRSQIALQKLQAHGIEDVFDIGAYKRAQQICPAN